MIRKQARSIVKIAAAALSQNFWGECQEPFPISLGMSQTQIGQTLAIFF